MTDTTDSAMLETLQQASARLRLLSPDLQVEADSVPATVLGSAELAGKTSTLMRDFGQAVNSLADDVEDLAYQYRQQIRGGETATPEPGQPGSILHRPLNGPAPHSAEEA
ncbi:hypothetical protein FHX42_005231 [Saccharopolyspora lacisalsi]|uniref:Uncharacterized protein n=1 Tax=Halosaccharopolyspora lacisalsi TaxID=1000566 RepID=A0A839E1V5_9PSEU|nr:hypothetical protein [Halosaccharopolyspora lacisalsi]MBA8827824.1 hypothetical protein [Halosaccharopolyspora lacisalsi]